LKVALMYLMLGVDKQGEAAGGADSKTVPTRRALQSTAGRVRS